jgi:hypothetical protein
MSASKRPRSTFTVGLREMSWTGIHQLIGAAIARLPRDRSRRIQEIEDLADQLAAGSQTVRQLVTPVEHRERLPDTRGRARLMARLYVQMQEARATPVPEPEMIWEVVRVADLQTRCTGRILATPDGELHQMPFLHRILPAAGEHPSERVYIATDSAGRTLVYALREEPDGSLEPAPLPLAMILPRGRTGPL